MNAPVRRTINQNRQIKHLISQTVPEGVLAHVLFCRIDKGRLRITVDEAGWIVKLRFLKSQLIDDLAEQNLQIESVSFHVDPLAGNASDRNKVPLSGEGQKVSAKTATAGQNRGAMPAGTRQQRKPDDRLNRELERFSRNAKLAKSSSKKQSPKD